MDVQILIAPTTAHIQTRPGEHPVLGSDRVGSGSGTILVEGGAHNPEPPPLLRTLAVPMESTDRGGKLRGRRYISRNINSTWSQHVLENCLQVNGRHVLLRTYDKGGLRRIISLDILKSMS